MRPIYLLLVAASLFSACSPTLTPFSREIYESQNWTDNDLKRIQFYLSDDLTIYRNIEENQGFKITGGEIKIRNGRKVEQIRFRRGTPGVFLFRPKDDHFAVSFESKDDTHYLMFGPNPKRGGEYQLLASEWDRRTGKVTYAGEKFLTESDAIPRLLVNLKREGSYKRQDRTASGRKVRGQ